MPLLVVLLFLVVDRFFLARKAALGVMFLRAFHDHFGVLFRMMLGFRRLRIKGGGKRSEQAKCRAETGDDRREILNSEPGLIHMKGFFPRFAIQ